MTLHSPNASRNSGRRVVVTGIGLVTPLGVGTKKTWDALLRGESGIGPITRFDTARFATRFAGEVRDFDALAFIERKEVRKMDLFTQYAVAAAQLAVEDSGIAPEALEGERTGVCVGSGIGGIGSLEETHKVLLEKGPDRVSPFFLVQIIINEAAGQISIRYKARGPNTATVTACSTGTHAIGDSFRMIARGDVDVMFAGGAEAPITPLSLAGFNAIKALSTRNDEPKRASRPFDAERDGFVMGEGAGIVLLEELEQCPGQGRPHLRRDRRLRGDRGRLPRHEPVAGRGGGGAGDDPRARRRRGPARRGRLHQRPRHLDAPTTTRRRRSPSRPSSASMPGASASARPSP